MGLLESIIRSAQQGGGGGLGDILGQLGRQGQSSTGNTLDEIQRRMGQSGSNGSAPAGDISIEDLERQMGIGRKGSGTGGYTQSQQPYKPYPQQQQYPQQPYQPDPYPQQYPQETSTIPVPEQEEQQSSGGGLFGGGLMSILKVIGMGALAAYVLRKFNK